MAFPMKAPKVAAKAKIATSAKPGKNMGKFEGSPKDLAQDAKAAKKSGMSAKAYEKSPADAKADAAGDRAMTKGHEHLRGSKHFGG